MGSIVNPKFEKASYELIDANKRLRDAQSAVEKSDNQDESSTEVQAMRKAEEDMHAAESVWCNLQGVVDVEGKPDDPAAEQKVQSLMNKVSIFYS